MAVQRDAWPNHPLWYRGRIVDGRLFRRLSAADLLGPATRQGRAGGAPRFLVAVIVGFFLHSAWSFRGHGTRDSSGRQHLKFLVVQGFGLALNALFTWIVTGLMHQQPWVALIPVVTITPIATFALNRQWVFG